MELNDMRTAKVGRTVLLPQQRGAHPCEVCRRPVSANKRWCRACWDSIQEQVQQLNETELPTPPSQTQQPPEPESKGSGL